MSLLIIGGTGTLGRQIVKQALNEGYQVKCFTRNLRRALFLKSWGAELIDWKGKVALIEAAKIAKVQNFIFFSVLGASSNSSIPLIDLKLKISKLLETSAIPCTIYQCSGFFQGIINQYAIPVLENNTVWLLGKSNPIAYLDTQDAARAVISNLKNITPGTRTLALIGKKFWTSEEVVALCERLSGKEAKILYIPNIILGILRRFFRFFEFTWNISDRLQFSELNVSANAQKTTLQEVSWSSERLGLENYLQEYFGKIMKKLKETNYQQSQNNDISFL